MPLLGKPFAHQTWAKGLDDKGRPIVLPDTDPTPIGVYVCPDATGVTNWAAPPYDPVTACSSCQCAKAARITPAKRSRRSPAIPSLVATRRRITNAARLVLPHYLSGDWSNPLEFPHARG